MKKFNNLKGKHLCTYYHILYNINTPGTKRDKNVHIEILQIHIISKVWLLDPTNIATTGIIINIISVNLTMSLLKATQKWTMAFPCTL